MKQPFLLMLLLCCCAGYGQNKYERTADSRTKANNKYGEHIYTKWSGSSLFPGTVRNIDVYVPYEYDGQQPACVCIFQDGMLYNADTVVSNMIAAKEIPVMILIAASPGKVTGDYDSESVRENRTYEYDTPSPEFGNFLLQELLPYIETLKTRSGHKIVLSKERNDRMIAGCSSGAACAFNVAWNTNEFARVYSSCGSFTGLRGSFANATLVHKLEPKPIRFYLQSGSNDMWTSFGDWWSANQAMARALDFSGYDFKYTFTENASHCDEDGTVIFPEVMRFLWKGYPANPPALKNKTRNAVLNQTLIDGEGFELVARQLDPAAKLVSDNRNVVLIATSKKTTVLTASKNNQQLIADKKVIAAGIDNKMLVYDQERKQISIRQGRHVINISSRKINVADAVALRDGGFYIAGNYEHNEHGSVLWYLTENNELLVKDTHPQAIGSMALSGNNNWLYIFEYNTRRGYSYKVNKADKKVLYKQEFFYIHVPDQYDGAATSAAICDDYGRTYLATNMGIQICDYNGRSEGILSLPQNARPVSITWGGTDLQWLYVLCADGTIYRRKFNTRGAAPFSPMPKIRVGAG